jgi:hypothetical protein
VRRLGRLRWHWARVPSFRMTVSTYGIVFPDLSTTGTLEPSRTAGTGPIEIVADTVTFVAASFLFGSVTRGSRSRLQSRWLPLGPQGLFGRTRRALPYP